MLKDFPFHKTT